MSTSNPRLYGFTQHKGTGTDITNIEIHFEEELEDLEEGYSIARISTHFSEAFDLINHNGLTFKLIEKDIRNNITKLSDTSRQTEEFEEDFGQ